jgi:hypothetical protein
MSRVTLILLGGFLLATSVAWGGMGRFTGQERGAWREGANSVIIAKIVSVKAIPLAENDAYATHAAVFKPMATLAGHFDPSTKSFIDVRIWKGPGGTSSVHEIPAAGSFVIAVILPADFDDKPHPFMFVDSSDCTFMPDWSAMAPISGLSDAKVAETLARIREARAHPDQRPGGPMTNRAAETPEPVKK